MSPDIAGALRVYGSATLFVSATGYGAEMDWQRRSSLSDVEETQFLGEAAWVVLCSGFRERGVRRVFNHVSLCFCDWESAKAIVDSDPICRTTALASFANKAKIDAIAEIAHAVYAVGFGRFKANLITDAMTELRRLPFIGPVTVFHLAKNLGLDVAKPDRHLARLSSKLGFFDTDHLCGEVSRLTGEQKKVVDLVLWRYLAAGNRLELQ